MLKLYTQKWGNFCRRQNFKGVTPNSGELHDGLGGHSLEEFEGAESAAAGV
jgi:hypothetical protein